MASLGLVPGADNTVFVDVNRKVPEPLVVYDGPVESETWGPMWELPGNTRLQGRIWTSGPRVVIRYYSATLPDGQHIPFCAVASDGEGPGITKSPSRPGSAAIESSTHLFVTGQFK